MKWLLETGTTKTPEGAPLRYELGTLFVPENRAVPTSRIIGVGFARIRAVRPTGAPPVFILPCREVGDVVVMDQRGYSTRGEVLLFPRRAQPLEQPRSLTSDGMPVTARRSVPVGRRG